MASVGYKIVLMITVLKGQCIGSCLALVNIHNYRDVIMCNTTRIKRLSEIENYSTQISNIHKCLPMIDRVDKAIHGLNKALANSMRLFSHGQTTFQHTTSHIST